MTFGEKLKKLRTDNGLTQEELADKLFVTRTAVSKWETGKGFPAIDSLKLISQLFQISIDELISDGDIENKRLLDAKRARIFYWISVGFLAITAIFALLTWLISEPLMNIGSLIGCTGCIVFGSLARSRDKRRSYVAYIVSRAVIFVILAAVMVGAILQMT